MIKPKYPVCKKWDLVLVQMNPVIGSEIVKTRPALIVSPNVMNSRTNKVLVMPLTTTRKGYPFRLPVAVNGIQGEVCPDHLRSLDKQRIHKKLGVFPERYREPLKQLLTIFFSE